MSSDARRLIFFAPSPSQPGGAERRTRILAAGLAARGWEVLIIGRSAAGFTPSTYREGSVLVLEVPGFGISKLGAGAFLLVALMVSLVAGMRARAFLALQLSSPATAAAWCGLLIRRPFLILSSTTGVLNEGTHLKGRSGRIRRRLLGRAAVLVAQTEQGLAELTELLPTVPAVIMPNPVVPRNAPPLTGAPRAAFAGRLSEEKDLLRLLGAWERLIAERPEARLALVGRGIAGGADYRSVESEVRAAVKRSARLRGSVRLTGWLDDPETELTSADVFVFPSVSEGMSNALLEACALGRIVVASAIPGNIAVVGPEYPLLFPVGDELGLLNALRVAFDDDAVRTRCREIVLERTQTFAPDVAAERLERLILDADRRRHQ